MRRIGRWLLNALTALSLLMCVGTVAMWVRSAFYEDAGRWWWLTFNFEARSAWGGITLKLELHPEYPELAGTKWAGHFPYGTPTSAARIYPRLWSTGVQKQVSFAGIEYGRQEQFGMDVRAVVVPFALPAIVSALLPAFAVVRGVRHRRRVRHGMCRRCHYDLTGNVSGVCPECGTKIAEAK